MRLKEYQKLIHLQPFIRYPFGEADTAMIVHLPTRQNHGNGIFRTVTDSISLRIQDATDERGTGLCRPRFIQAKSRPRQHGHRELPLMSSGCPKPDPASSCRRADGMSSDLSHGPYVAAGLSRITGVMLQHPKISMSLRSHASCPETPPWLAQSA